MTYNSEIMKKPWALLVGKNTSPGVAILLAASGLSFGVYAFVQGEGPLWQRLATGALAADVGAGLISNARPGTNLAWRDRDRVWAVGFIAVHLTVYPALLWLLCGPRAHFGLLLALLLCKTGFFALGVLGKRRD